MKVLFLTLAVLILASTAMAQPSGIYPLPGIDPTLPYDDLIPLDSIIGDSHFVGLGESVHASEGFIEAKARIIRYLVEKKGFRMIEMETPWHAANLTANYILTCVGTPKAALSGIFSVWYSESTENLLQWLCEFNRAHSNDPVIFKGIDIQNETLDDLADLRTFFALAASSDADSLMANLSSCFGYGLSSADYQTQTQQIFHKQISIADADNTGCSTGIATLWNYFSAHKADLISVSSTQRESIAEVALYALQSLQGQLYGASTGNENISMEARDRGMAELVTRLRDVFAPDAKTIIWAHNMHLAMDSREISQIRYDYDSMGTDLRARLGDNYAPIGMTGYQVSYLWPGKPVATFPVPGLTSVEGLLHTQPYSQILVDLSGGFLVPDQSYQLSVDDYMGWTIPSKQYRGLIFLQTSDPMVPPR